MGLTRIRAEQISDIDYKQAVRVITLTDITLSGGAPAEVDGVSLTVGDRVLVNGQSNLAQNGLYQVQTVGAGSNGTWVRTSDANQDGEIQPGMVVMVTQGTVYADTPWKLVTNGEIIIGTTELTFQENYSLAFGNVFANGTAVVANAVSAALTLSAGDNISITGNNISKTVTIAVTGISLTSIANGTSNVDIATADGNVTTTVNGNTTLTITDAGANITGYLAVTGNTTSGNILTDGYFYANGAPFEPGGVPGGSNTSIQFNDDDVFGGSADFTWDGAELYVNGAGNITGNLTVGGTVTGNGIPTTTVSSTPPAGPEQGDVWIDSDTGIQYIYFSDGNSSQWAEMEAYQSFSSGGSGSVDLSAVAQDIIPSANATYSLGNATNRWSNLFLVGNTIDLGGAQIKADAASGAIALIPAATANVTNPTALVISASGAINTANTVGGEISGDAIANSAATATPVGAPRIANIVVTGNTYSPTGATAVALEGGYVQITGNGFQSGCQAIIGSNNATSTGFSSSETLDVEVPAQSAGSYIVYVVNPDGAVALRPNGITYSGLPTWVTGSTLPGQVSDAPISIQLEATSDSAVTYALAAGSSLPANVSISSAGLISGTASVQELTVFSFTVIATDAESQSSPRTFDLTVDVVLEAEYLVVAGGGAGSCNANGGGGGGAGGFRTGSGFTIDTATNYTVTVGAGGTGSTGAGTSGGNSVFSTITSAGGGGGTVNANGTAGGSGSGAPASSLTRTGGAGNTPATDPSQGNNGGNNNNGAPYPGGGGGGAGAVGGTGSGSQSGAGGAGQSSSITGVETYYAGGGGGGGTVQGSAGGAGGTGGGGAGGSGSTNGTAGTANTGGGSGGGGNDGGRTVANGGSGVVILKYLSTLTISNPGGGLTYSTATADGFSVTTFTAGTGTIQWN